jgi:hypothetical protein
MRETAQERQIQVDRKMMPPWRNDVIFERFTAAETRFCSPPIGHQERR